MNHVHVLVAILFFTVGTSESNIFEDFFIPNRVEVGVLEDLINKSVECVRGVLQTGYPDLNFPSFEPLIIGEMYLDFDKLNIPDIITGYLNFSDIAAVGITAWLMTSIKGDLIIIPPTYTVNFSLWYSDVVGTSDYDMNITILGNSMFGNGLIYSGVTNLTAAGHVKAIINGTGVHLTEFNAPIALEAATFQITGLMGNETFSKEISEQLSNGIPEYINSHPELFTEVISPILIALFNALVHDDIGVGIVKRMVQECIIDILPTQSPLNVN